MEFKIKNFDELTTKELYEILKARAEVFVVEQNCVYQDLDDKDYECLHMFYEEEGKIVAYLRSFKKQNDENTIQFGRVLTINRGAGLGRKILKDAILEIRKNTTASKIFLEAQTYAIKFYENEGFKVCSEEFLEDGIPHIEMVLEIK